MKRNFIPWFFLSLFLNSCTSGRFTAKEPQSFQWVELGPDSKAIVRTVTPEEVCPKVRVDGVNQAMVPRGLPSEKFPVRVCELELPAKVQTASLNGQILQLPSSFPKKIVVIGDTGCRMKGSSQSPWVQSCNDPRSWPFQKVAKLAAEWKPELVIHLGDYLYREAPCPNENPGCQGSPWGDRWETWQADFFTPSASLLNSAPWIFVRGNHELCKRGGGGWFRLLDPRPYPEQCDDTPSSYWALFNPSLFVLDSASVRGNGSKGEVSKIAEQLKKAQDVHGAQGVWILTHQPFWGVMKPRESGEDSRSWATSTLSLQKALQEANLATLNLVLSGHIHLFEFLKFEDGGASQIIAGNSGTDLTLAPGELDSLKIGNRQVKEGLAIQEFGFLALERLSSGQWDATAYGVNGKELFKTVLK